MLYFFLPPSIFSFCYRGPTYAPPQQKRLTKRGRPAGDAAQGYGGGRVKETLDAKAKWTRPES